MKTIKTHSSFGKQVKVFLLVAILATTALTIAQAQVPPTPNIETIPTGSWIIAMDNDNQGISGVMNVRAYGLAVELLWNDIPLKWAIKTGKVKDEPDMIVKATGIIPSLIADPVLNIGHNQDAITSWGFTSSNVERKNDPGKYNGSNSFRLKTTNHLTMNNVDITNFEGVKLSFAYAANLVDPGDNLILDFSYNGGSSWTTQGTGSISIVSPTSNNESFDINTTTANTVSSNPFVVDIPSTANQIMVRFRSSSTLGSSEFYYIDDIQLTAENHNYTFISGPLVILPSDTAAARTVINAYNTPLAAASKIKIYQTDETISADIRYTITHKPYIGIFDDGGNAKVHEENLIQAGIGSNKFQRINAGVSIDTTSCFTMTSEPHWNSSYGSSSDTMRLNNLKFFMETGGNFLAQCAAVETIENFQGDNFQMTNGLLKGSGAGSAAQVQYMNADIPSMQFHGQFLDAGGSLNSFLPPANSAWRSETKIGTYFLKNQISGTGLDTLAHISSIKLSPEYVPGGYITYLSGHNYGGSTLTDINGLRVYYNMVLIPVNRALPNGSAYAGTPSLCVNDTLKLFVDTPTVGSYTYSWTGPNGFTSTTQNPVIPGFNASKAGQYRVTLTQSGLNCKFTYPPVAVTYIESNIGDVNAISTLVSCFNEEGMESILETIAPLEGTGTWSVVSGPGQIVDPTAFTTSVTGLSTTGTPSTIKWLVTTSQGCKDSSVVTINPTVINHSSVSKYDNEYCLNCPVKSDGWYYFYDLDGKLLAGVDGSVGSDVETAFCARLTYALPGDPDEDDVPLVAATYAVVQPYLPRFWQLKGQPNVMVPVKVYFTDQELAALMGWCNGGSIYEFYSVNALYVTYYPENPGAFTLPGSAGGVLLTPHIRRVGEHWEASFTVPGHSTFYLHPIEFGGAPLPVELVSLDAQPLETSILVNWQTASERNASLYDVERSTDGVSFLKVGIVNASGNSNTLKNYFFEDSQVEKNIRYYYRLKQVDYDGSYTHTHTVSAVIESRSSLRIGDFFPNPSGSAVALNIVMPEDGQIEYRLFSLEGRQIYASSFELDSGANELRFDLSALPAGTYIGQFNSKYGNETKRIVKAN